MYGGAGNGGRDIKGPGDRARMKLDARAQIVAGHVCLFSSSIAAAIDVTCSVCGAIAEIGWIGILPSLSKHC
jgi:hypothetical protein